MKFIYIIIFLALPSLLFAQQTALNQNVDLSKSSEFQPDPFTSYMLKTENPCNDHHYLELKNKLKKEMSDSEEAIFGKKAEACQSYLNKVTKSRTDTVKVETNNGSTNPAKPYILAGGVVAVTVLVIIAV